jgi:sacsin
MQELDENKSLEMLDSIGSFSRTSIAEKLRSPSFADAVWMVVQEVGEGVPSLKQSSNKENLVKSLSFAADGLWFVRRLYTRFLMLPGRQDVTRQKRPFLSNDPAEMGHRVFEYVDKGRDRILIATPLQGVTLPDLLAVVVSRLLGSPLTLPIGPLFTASAGTDMMTVLQVLRLGANANKGGKSSMENSGVLGMELVGPDAALVQCHPLRPFHAGEIVAWRSDNQVGLRYGRVLHDVRASAGQALYRLEVETGPNEIRMLLSSQVLSFKGTAMAAALPPADLESEANELQAAVSNLTGLIRRHAEPGISSEATSSEGRQVQVRIS